MPRFTFRKIPRSTGLAKFGELGQDHEIKLDGRRVGDIHVPSVLASRTEGTAYRIRLMVKREPTAERPAPFENITLVWRGETAEAGREFILRNAERILEKYRLHSHDD